MPKTVGDLRKAMKGLSDDTLLVTTGHFGELITEGFSWHVREHSADVAENHWSPISEHNREAGPFFVLWSPELGEEPD
jgi:hypothetical protein